MKTRSPNQHRKLKGWDTQAAIRLHFSEVDGDQCGRGKNIHAANKYEMQDKAVADNNELRRQTHFLKLV